MLTALIAVLGTLAGALLTGTLAHLTQRSQRAATEAAARRTEALDAVTGLATALADHRRTMYLREERRLRGEDWTTERAESHTTRAAITAPLMRLAILLPTLAPAAQTAADAACALRAVTDDTTLHHHGTQTQQRFLRPVAPRHQLSPRIRASVQRTISPPARRSLRRTRLPISTSMSTTRGA
ncbi:hypothetical protein OHA98_41620 [Streptomyces sp. NBC_00654]|uniref:hypothetical protein n=1 Tax=Streptomyces sp. NBC_00654 TaxID=2975799 RepID=UPI002254804D|nr:hypothetical protein [Streptomyces sp. NBC_00654]MCX4971108.1 hypothetical protein [Streptomyces sp. NBC_00654]